MDFERAEYTEPRIIEGEVVGQPLRMERSGAFPLALALGAVAAAVGSIGYALVGLSGFMVSIVAIGIGWLIAKAMMTATGGVGGRPYQIAAVVLTYFAVTCGELLHPVWSLHHEGVPVGVMMNSVLFRYALFGPFLQLSGNAINGVLGLIILGVGLRAAWKLAAGSPGFGGRGSGHRVTPFG